MARFFNKNLKFLRQQKNISQQELADKLKLDRSTISRWENNEMDATVENAIQVADVLSVSLEDLTGRDLTIENNRTFDELELLFNKHKDILSERDKAIIKTIIEERIKEIDKELGEN